MKRLWVHKHAYTTGISCFKMPHFVSRISFDNLFHQWRTITTRCAACSATRKKKQTADNWNGVNWEAVECESKCKKSKKKYIYVLQYDNYSANGKKCGEKKRVWCVNIKWDDIADLLLQVVFFPLSWSALKDSTQQEKKKKHNIGIHYLNDIVLPCSDDSHMGSVSVSHIFILRFILFFFLNLLGSLTLILALHYNSTVLFAINSSII